jgi:proteasome accessory factor B
MAKRPSNAVSKYQRWVDLMSTLLGRYSALSFEELMPGVPAYAEASVASARRMFERDKSELRSLGVPVETVGEDGDNESAYRIRTKDFYLPYLSVLTERGPSKPNRVDRFGYRALAQLTFEPDELAAVADAAVRVRQLGDPALVADVDSAMRKLAFDLPLDAALPQADVVVALSRAPASPETLRTLSSALIARKRVVIDYYTMSRDDSAIRELEPFGLFFLNSNWYLAAREAGAVDVKNFRVSRVKSCSVHAGKAGTPDYEVPSTFQLRVHASSRQAWELGSEPPVEVVVDIRGASGATLAASALGQSIGGSKRRRRFSVRRPDAFARWLLSFGGEMVPVEPPSVCDEYGRQIEATLALYGGTEARGR